jgi:hypothetical protein
VILVWPDVDQTSDEVQRLLRGVEDHLVVATWDATAGDGGRTDLLASVRDARAALTSQGEDADSLVIIGLGRGAVAAAGLTRYARRLGIGLGRVLCVAPEWDEPDPFSGAPLSEVPERVELVPDVASVATCWRPR